VRNLNSRRNIIVGLLLFLYFAGFVAFAWHANANLHTYLFDLGLQEQTIWNTSQGRWFQSSPEVANFLGDHFSPLLLPVALIYKVFPDTLTLFVIQVAAITLGILAFYKLALLKLKHSWVQWLVLIGMLCYWPLSGALTFPFHEVTLAFPFLAWGIYFLETSGKGQSKRIITGLVLLFTAMLAKEDVGVFVGMLGLYYLIFRKKKWGGLAFAVGLIWSFLALFVFIPYFRNGASSDTFSRYSYLGVSFSEIFHTLVNRFKLIYLLKLFVPMLPLVVIIPEALVLIGPSLAVNLLSSSLPMVSADAQYDVILSAGIFFLTILAWQKLEILAEKGFKNKLLAKFKLKYLGFLLAAIYAVLLVLHPVWRKLPDIIDRSADYQYLQEIKQTLPTDASLSVSNSLGVQLAHFQNLYLFDPPWLDRGTGADYILIDLKEYSGWKDLSKDPAYKLLIQKGNIQVYKRAG